MLKLALVKVKILWQLNIAGEATHEYINEFETLAKELDISQQINWLGWLNGAKKIEALKETDLFMLTSRNENFANVVLESLACGTPVLLSKQVGLSHYIAQHPILGHVCSLETSDIAAQIEQIYKQQSTTGIDGEAIRRQVRSDFDSEKIARQYLEAYQKFIYK